MCQIKVAACLSVFQCKLYIESYRRGFDSQSSCYQVVTIRLGDSLQPGDTPQYITNQPSIPPG